MLADVFEAAPASRLATLPPWPEEAAPPTLGWLAAQWAEKCLIQPNGPRAGQKFRLTRDQLTFLLWWYALDSDAHWLFHHGARRLAKGSGKSPFAAVLALIEFCAPVRLAKFDDREIGGVHGRPVDMPLVQIAATAESQTANTMRMVRAFAPKGSAVVREFGLDPGKTRYYKLPEGTLEVITSSVTAAEGGEASFIVADETEHWTPGHNGPELASTLADNLAKSGSRMLETSNAWVPGIGSVAEATWDGWVAQEEGLLQGSSRILYDARVAKPDTRLDSIESLEPALQWVYGDCDWKRRPDDTIDVSAIIERIWSGTTLRSETAAAEAKRKYLNRPSVARGAWVEPEQWLALEDRSKTISPRDEVVLFFDGSKSRDATALVGCRVSDGHVFVCGVWEPNPNDDEETVDVADVDRVVEVTFRDHNVVAFFADVREWEQFTLTTWPQRYATRLRTFAVPGGRPPHPIAWDMRSHTYEFAKACEVVEGEIGEGGFTHDGSSVLARHVANAQRNPYRDAVGIAKESPSSPRKIDAAVAMIGARMVRRLVLAESKRKRSGIVW